MALSEPPSRSLETGTLAHIVKWFVLATGVGILTGLASAAFQEATRRLMDWYREAHWVLWLLPAVLAAVAWADERVLPRSDAHTTDKVIFYLHQLKKVPPLSGLKAFFLPLVTLGFGGSTGKEAPCADMGAAFGSSISGFLRLSPEEHRILTICGISAGFSAVLGTPIAGALFGIEVLFVGGLLYDILLPAFVAGIVGYQVCAVVGVDYLRFPSRIVPVFSESFMAMVLLSGVFFGACSLAFIGAMRGTRAWVGRWKIPVVLKAVLGGLIVVAVGFGVSRDYTGLGIEVQQRCLRGETVPLYGFFLKILTTCATLGMGGSGGLISPIFFVGAEAGQALARVSHLDPVTFSAIGMVSVLAGCANTPVAASVLALELFSPELAAYAAFACIVTFLVTGHRSIYPSQNLKMKQPAALHAEIGRNISRVGKLFSRSPE